MRVERRGALLLLAALVSSCASRPPPPPPKAPEPPPADPGMIRTARFTIHYEPGLRKDAERFRGYLDKALKAIVAEFGPYRPLDLLRDVVFDIHLESKRPFELVSLEYAMTGGRYKAKLRLLSPSLAPADARSNIGEPLDEAYYLKIAVQKYASVWLDVLLRSKPSGWTFNSAPSWFVQGYLEYLGLVRSSDHNRLVTLPKYEQLFRENPGRIRPDLKVVDFQIDGAMLVLFMHQRFGTDRVQALLLRPEVEFPDALQRELGLSSMSDFYRKWREWLRDRLAQPASAPPGSP